MKKLSIGPWAKGRLLLIDLGYYCFSLFDRIQRNGGFFVSRVKSNANFEIASSHLVCRGRSVKLEGKKLQEVLPKLKRQAVDLEVWVPAKRRPYEPWQTTVTSQSLERGSRTLSQVSSARSTQ